uniref:SUN domain-containing protein n=1 Tax=Sparus aurata TaxID=8175 RepID=A0A671Y319_SPAAU
SSFPADRSLIARFLQDVHVIVQNALRLFSQDRTGLADYALESGGQKLRARTCISDLLVLGSKGFLVIRLSMRILPTAFSLEHIPKSLAPSGTLRSAPRDFSVYVRETRQQKCAFWIQERGELLGTYTYDEDGEALQTYSNREVRAVQVLSNWGHPDYTCMYRFRVHGTPGDL